MTPKKISSPICQIICAACDALIAVAWGQIYDQDGNLYDLCAKDERRIRRADVSERRKLIAEMIERKRMIFRRRAA